MKYFGFYVTLVLLLVLFTLVPSVFDIFTAKNSIYSTAIRGIFAALIAIMTLGMVHTTLKTVDNIEPTIMELFTTHRLLKYIATSLLYLGMFIGGLALFIVPGIYWGLKYQFSTYLILEKGMTLTEAFEKSAEMVAGYEWDLLAYWLLMLMLNTIGLLLFGVGIIFTLPITIVGYSYLYKQLRKIHGWK